MLVVSYCAYFNNLPINSPSTLSKTFSRMLDSGQVFRCQANWLIYENQAVYLAMYICTYKAQFCLFMCGYFYLETAGRASMKLGTMDYLPEVSVKWEFVPSWRRQIFF